MVIENRIKGLFVKGMGLIYLAIFIYEVFYKRTSFPVWVEYAYLPFAILLMFFGYYLFIKKNYIELWLEYVLMTIFIVYSYTIVVYTGTDYSNYFPYIFLVPLLYTSFSRGYIFFIINNIVVFSLIGYWSYLYTESLQLLYSTGFIIHIIIYGTVVSVIRNYRFDCFRCELKLDTCPYKVSCALYKVKSEYVEDGLHVNEFYKES